VEVTGRGRVASENLIFTAQSDRKIKNEMGIQHAKE
jgi:hypothetical protein